VFWQNRTLEAPQFEMGFVFQRPTLLEWLSVLDNVLLPISLHKKIEPIDLDNAKRLLYLIGLENKTNDKPSELSGGQQSRVAIARALIYPLVFCLWMSPLLHWMPSHVKSFNMI
jgi:NitT/TauT family transport system ATP-binding protein